MQVFNVGALELLFILILAFLVLGPKRAIKTARDIGGWIRNLVRSPIWREIVHTSNEIRDLPKKIMDDAELSQMMNELDLSAQEIKEILRQNQHETNASLANLEAEVNQELQSTTSQQNPSAEEN